MTQSSTSPPLLPSLLDRLTDEEPEKQVESRTRRTLSLQGLREVVLRDLAWLLNTNSLEATEDLEDYPFLADSVVNYGTPDLAGVEVSSLAPEQIERMIQQALVRFEPRILRNTVSIRAQKSPDHAEANSVTLEIEAEVWGQPLPQQLFLKTEIDLETGAVSVQESTRRSSG